MAKPRARRSSAPRGRVLLLVATRKGAFVLRADAARSRFRLEGPHFLGHVGSRILGSANLVPDQGGSSSGRMPDTSSP